MRRLLIAALLLLASAAPMLQALKRPFAKLSMLTWFP